MRKIALLIFACCVFCSAHGQIWHDPGGGVTFNNFKMDYGIYAIVNDTVHHYLYVGGGFDSVGHLSSKNLARWDGKNWSSIGGFSDTAIFAMCMFNDTLIVGDYLGNITFIDSAGKILKQFSADGFVYSLTTYKGELYVGGEFDEINNVTALGIARFNGVNWESVDTGFQNCCGLPIIWALYSWNNKLYAGGSFFEAGNIKANNIAVWNDSIWAPLAEGTYRRAGIYNDGYVFCLGSFNSNLYVGGEFDSASGVFAKNIAKWNGNTWDSVSTGLNYLPNKSGVYGVPYCFENYQGNLYIGGILDSAGVVEWNDTFYSCPDNGLHHGDAFAIDTFKGELYAGGIFDSAGEIKVNNIARLSKDSTTTFINNLTDQVQIVIYPNPTTNQLTITTKNFSISKLQIENVLGQTIIEKVVDEGLDKQTIDVSALAAGIYFYKATSFNGELASGKFVKE